jgi:SAM-dependent methyltransferase
MQNMLIYCLCFEFRKPANCEFEIDNLELDWAYFEEFDFIHCRNTLFRNPVRMIRSAYDALKPGGDLEFQQFDYQLRCIDDSWNDTSLSNG